MYQVLVQVTNSDTDETTTSSFYGFSPDLMASLRRANPDAGLETLADHLGDLLNLAVQRAHPDA